MSFFIRKLNNNLDKSGKRKRFTINGKSNSKKIKPADEEIESDDENVIGTAQDSDLQNEKLEENHTEFLEETEQEKKIRVAKQYLNELHDIDKLKKNDEELNKDAVNFKLKEDVLKKLGTLYTKIADLYIGVDEINKKTLKNGHKLSLTCCAVSADSQFVYTGSKDCCIIKWDLNKGRKIKMILGGKKGSEREHKGHTTIINALAVSSDSKYLASGCNSNFINIWNADNLEFIHQFKGHSGLITGLIFRKHGHTLYSISKDRSLRVWNLDTMCYEQTLFGHQETITSIDMLLKERAITSGGYDSTVRLWKVAEESQLIFLGKGESIDCVKYIDEQHFISGSVDGSIALWSVQKKKPLDVISNAHGIDKDSETSNWIISIAANPFSDVFASGSNDGFVRLWKYSNNKIEHLFSIPLTGFINDLSFANEGKTLVACVGQEHKLGRWWRKKDCKNSLVIIPLKVSEST